MRKRIAVLTSDDHHHQYLAALLGKHFDVVCLIVEPWKAQRRRLRDRGKRLDYTAWTYHSWRRKIFGLDRYRRRYFSLESTGLTPAGGAHLVESVNDPSTAELVRGAAPDLIVICCTSILKDGLFGIAPDGIINIHGGFLPEFKGNHCFFWALYQRRFDCLGSTIHFVDKGIDTGDIICRVSPPIFHGDSAESIYCRADMLAFHELVRILNEYEAGKPIPRRAQKAAGRTFRTRDRLPHHDLIYWARRRFIGGTLPEKYFVELVKEGTKI